MTGGIRNLSPLQTSSCMWYMGDVKLCEGSVMLRCRRLLWCKCQHWTETARRFSGFQQYSSDCKLNYNVHRIVPIESREVFEEDHGRRQWGYRACLHLASGKKNCICYYHLNLVVPYSSWWTFQNLLNDNKYDRRTACWKLCLLLVRYPPSF